MCILSVYSCIAFLLCNLAVHSSIVFFRCIPEQILLKKNSFIYWVQPWYQTLLMSWKFKLSNIMLNISMWLHHPNRNKFGTGANYEQWSYSPSFKMQKYRHLWMRISLFTNLFCNTAVLNSENQILPNFANFWNIQTRDFKKLLHQMKI